MEGIKTLKIIVNKFTFAIFMVLALFLITSCGKAATQPATNLKTDMYSLALARLENNYGATLGIYAIDMETNKEVIYRADERFPYCSTYKALSAGAVLKQYSLDELQNKVYYTKNDVLSYAPIAKNKVDEGMTLEEICEAAIRFSDNTAGNLLFNSIGGPRGYKAGLELLGDNVTQPARTEPDLNEAIPGDIRDTSTPRQLAADLKAYATGNTLTDEKKKILIDWMTENATGNNLIRAGAPKDWMVADKSGAGSYGTRNDIAIVMPPNRKPIIIVVLSTRGTKDAKYDDRLIAAAAKVVFDIFVVPPQ